METPEFLTPAEVAERLKVTERTVYNWLRKGILTGQKFGGIWRVRATSLAEPATANGSAQVSTSSEAEKQEEY